MKIMKKSLALVLAVVLALALAIPAMAADNYPITVNNENATAAHTYTAYQVFAGTLSEKDGNKVLSNITWGSGVDGAALLTDLKKVDAFKDCASALDVADVVKGFSDNSTDIEAFADIVGKHLTTGTASTPSADFKTNTINASAPGYYIIKETGTNPETERSASGYMIEVIGPATMNVKDGPLTPDKNILQNGETKVKEGTANVGDTVTFVVDQIKVPNVDGYKTYKFVMKDTLPKGLTFGSVTSVKLDKTGNALAASAYTVSATTNGDGTTTLLVAINDALNTLKDYEGKEVEIVYTATVNKDANFGNTGNKNEVVFEFSNNPDSEETGNTFGPDEPHGTTPKSETTTYVTTIKVLKVDESNAPLANAVFTLAGESKNIVVTTGQQFVVAETGGTHYKLADGTYTTTAPTQDTADKYASTDTMYKLQPLDKTELTGANNVNIENVASGSDGIINFEGLKPGTYTLTETGAPEGYNKINDPISFTIKFDTTTKKFAIDGTAPAGVTLKDDGTFEIKVENKSGAELPSTGGIGTKIFYTMGAVLVIGAGVVLVSRKRAAE